MTIDCFSGNVTKIKVQNQEFNVVKHITPLSSSLAVAPMSSLYKTRTGNFTSSRTPGSSLDHGISEIACPLIYQQHSRRRTQVRMLRYTDQCIPDLLWERKLEILPTRRGRLTNTPPERLHRRVVTGPVGDPLTSFRSREEFVQVLLDCVKCKSSIQYRK
jgi:hypothetical protein